VPGGNGTYYWNTSHTQKTFVIDFAFDDLREEDIRRLKQHFSFNGVKELIFDEAPYKKYYVKCSAPPTLSYIPFSDLGNVINYKGEGNVNLVAYYPYGISTKEYEIGASSREEIHNLGDIEAPFKIYFPINGSEKTINISIGANRIVTGFL
jgi:phage-related protein